MYAIVPYDKDTYSDRKDSTIRTLSTAIEILLKEKEVTEIYYVDGGCDAFLKGDELGLGTPSEDIFTLKTVENAIASLHGTFKRYLLVVGMDVDCVHDVKPEDLERRLGEIDPEWSEKLSFDKEYVKKYCETVLSCNPEHSIVQSLVVGAIKGLRGYQVPLCLVPITDRLAQMFCFPVDVVFNQNVYWKGISLDFTCKKLDKNIGEKHERAYFLVVI